MKRKAVAIFAAVAITYIFALLWITSSWEETHSHPQSSDHDVVLKYIGDQLQEGVQAAMELRYMIGDSNSPASQQVRGIHSILEDLSLVVHSFRKTGKVDLDRPINSVSLLKDVSNDDPKPPPQQRVGHQPNKSMPKRAPNPQDQIPPSHHGSRNIDTGGQRGMAAIRENRRKEVRDTMSSAYGAYEKYAMGHDELKPVSRSYADWVPGGLAMTLIDALDTLLMMGMEKQFTEGVNWLKDNFSLEKDGFVSVFEVNIRLLGGLMSAYEMAYAYYEHGSGDGTDAADYQYLLTLAKQLADKLLVAFDTPSGIPLSSINLKQMKAESGMKSHTGEEVPISLLAEVGSFALEFQALSYYTNDNTYASLVLKVLDDLHDADRPYVGIYPVQIDYRYEGKPKFVSAKASVGAAGDSFYEYLLKIWTYHGQSDAYSKYLTMYDEAVDDILNVLVQSRGTYTYIADMKENGDLEHRMSHLACFFPGLLAYDHILRPNTTRLGVAERLIKTCYEMYTLTPMGLAPEYVRFSVSGRMSVDMDYYILRPETIESLFWMYRATANELYPEYAWRIFQAIKEKCYRPESGGFSGINSVSSTNAVPIDATQTFFYAETLKYLYLIMSKDDELRWWNVDDFVFTTEAHVLRRHRVDADGRHSDHWHAHDEE